MYINDFATEAQLRVLLQHTGVDYSNDGITKKKASILIRKSINKNKTVTTKVIVKKEPKANKGIESEFMQYMKDNLDKFVDTFYTEVYKVKSVIGNDTKLVKDDGKRYVFFGYGCAQVWMIYNKNSKKASEINSIANKNDTKVRDMVAKKLGTELINKLTKMGAGFGAIWMQDLSMQFCYWHLVADFCRQNGIKNVNVSYRMD